MTEQLTRVRFDALMAAVAKEDGSAVLEHGLALAAQVFIDLSRCAHALEVLAGIKPKG